MVNAAQFSADDVAPGYFLQISDVFSFYSSLLSTLPREHQSSWRPVSTRGFPSPRHFLQAGRRGGCGVPRLSATSEQALPLLV